MRFDGSVYASLQNHGFPTTSSDAFIVKIPLSYPATTNFTALQTVLYGGFGEEFAHAIAYNPASNMVYIAATRRPANRTSSRRTTRTFPSSPTTRTLPGLPGPGPNARGGFVVAFNADATFSAAANPIFGSYVAVSSTGNTAADRSNFETITGIAAEGGCSSGTANCIGHIYITGATTSIVPSNSIAAVVPTFACGTPLKANSVPPSPATVLGPGGITITLPTGVTQPANCVTALITQAPFNTNQAVTTGCQFPLPLNFVPKADCNFSAYVAILDGALLNAPSVNAPAPVGNQIEYWAYYSSANASTIANAIAIDTNPTTASSIYSLGTYQQMYITGSTEQTSNGAGFCQTIGANSSVTTQTTNCLPRTNVTANPGGSTFLNPSEIFTSYNVGTTTGGGVGGYTPYSSIAQGGQLLEVDAYVARFNPNGLAASSYGGLGSTASGILQNQGWGTNQLVAPLDRSRLIHTPQFNFGEFLYGTRPVDTTSTPNTVGNAIAVDPTRATLIGGATNVTADPTGKTCTPITTCNFTTVNALSGSNSGGTDGWVSVLFFNDILTNAASQASANPWLQPGAPLLTPNPASLPGPVTTAGCTAAGNCSYIEVTPAPFGPTFDFAISDLATQTQTFQVIFTGQAAGQLAGTTPWFVPLDVRTGANPPTFDNNLPGSGISYYVPCQAPSPGSVNTGNNAYPAPGGAYGPMTCGFPSNHLYEGLPLLYTGYPGLATTDGTLTTPGWLLVSQDINPGVVRLQLDRRAAAGLLEGTYVAQFLVTTYDSQHQSQWPPCGPTSVQNPFQTIGACVAANTPLPADNVSVLVTVRLVVRPTLFLSRNAGFQTGITSALTLNPLFGPTPGFTTQDGTSKVPNWLFTQNSNTAPSVAATDLNLLYQGIPVNNVMNVNAGPIPCVAGVGNPVVTSSTYTALGVTTPTATPITVPCPITPTDPAPFLGALYAAQVYTGNGTGDLTGNPPIMTFLYDVGTVSSPNLSVQQGLVPTRPELTGLANYNANNQGGTDPLTQRNDATLHDYYTTAEGAAAINVEAINCTGLSDPTVGNWLSVSIAGGTYWPICTNNTPATVGTVKAPARGWTTATGDGTTAVTIPDDTNNGTQISLDFKAMAFSRRPALNGIPTGLYKATVYVWSTPREERHPGLLPRRQHAEHHHRNRCSQRQLHNAVLWRRYQHFAGIQHQSEPRSTRRRSANLQREPACLRYHSGHSDHAE